MSVLRAGESCKDRPVKINHQVVVLDAADLSAESSFWAGVLGGTVDAEADWHMVVVDGEPRVGVQLAPEHVPPDWPDGSPPQQIHLDLWVDDFQAAHDEVMSLAAQSSEGRRPKSSLPTIFRSTLIRPGIRSACLGSTTPSSFRPQRAPREGR